VSILIPLQSICAGVELDVQVPAGLRGVRNLGADLRMFGAECVWYFFVDVRGRLAPGAFQSHDFLW
jgi:hypothetical protein